MNREQWTKDLRIVDEIVCKSGEALRILDQEGKHENVIVLRMLYWISVAVWHLLDDKIRGMRNDGKTD
jgi:hypothetical protein